MTVRSMSLTCDRLTVSSASVFDFGETLSDKGLPWRRPRRIMAHMARQVSEGLALTVRDRAGQLCLICGLWPEADYVEAWFAAGPGLPAQLRASVRLARRICEAAMIEAGLSEARAFIHPDSVAGARLAALFGFSAGEIVDHPLGPVQTFVRSLHGYGQIDLGDAHQVGEARAAGG